MSKNLVIVESPEKAKTIGNFLTKDYHVMASVGHIRDIEGVGKNSMGIDFNHQYAPNYVVDGSKTKLIEQLQSEANKADTVWLASDEDREGEAIAWHLKEVLQLPTEKTRRIVFHEITKPAIEEAILHPRDIDYNLVNAQQARRVLDRIVGFELSPILWRKITTGLSAGRVQSVAVRLIVEKEREIEKFQTTCQYRVVAEFVGKDVQDKNVTLKAELNHRFATEEEALAFLEKCKEASFYINDIQRKPVLRTPAPPFTTSLLQQEAARKLKFTVSKTMRLAQSLYEAGKITYMRTDSFNLSSLAIGAAKKEIVEQYGEQYHQSRQYHTHSKGAQEAHEAIRPTYMSTRSAGENADERKLYDLIWKRTIASQMADAKIEQTRIEVEMMGSTYLFVATGEVVLFDGFMAAYTQASDDETQTSILPNLNLRTQMQAREVEGRQIFTNAPVRYNEATLVHKMEELGIGRPSTYATIIDTIQSRQYVEKMTIQGKKREYKQLLLLKGKITGCMKTETYGLESMKLVPTDLGRMTNDFLVEQFPDVMSYDFTANEEETFDEIAEGNADWVKTVDSFYKTFHPGIAKVPSGKVSGRELGKDPKTGAMLTAKISKNGACVQMDMPGIDKPKFASLLKGQSIYTLTLEAALALFVDNGPQVVCQIDGEDVVLGEGKYGPYLKKGAEFVSLPKNISPEAVTEEQAIALFAKKQQMSEPIHDFGEIRVLHGRFGAYIKKGEKNYKIPRGTDAELLTRSACEAIIEQAEKEPAKK